MNQYISIHLKKLIISADLSNKISKTSAGWERRKTSANNMGNFQFHVTHQRIAEWLNELPVHFITWGSIGYFETWELMFLQRFITWYWKRRWWGSRSFLVKYVFDKLRQALGAFLFCSLFRCTKHHCWNSKIFSDESWHFSWLHVRVD